MKIYELSYIISPEISSEESDAKAKKIEAMILDKKGIISKQTNISAKTFSYPMGKSASGFWGALEFQMEPENIAEIKNAITKDEKIVRHMLTIKETQKIKKQRKGRNTVIAEHKQESETISGKKFSSKIADHSASESKQKVELKDIEQTLDEILG